MTTNSGSVLSSEPIVPAMKPSQRSRAPRRETPSSSASHAPWRMSSPEARYRTAVSPPAGAAYMDRSDVRPGMAYWGGALVDAFAAVGWQWGGRWSSPDYQHFSSSGG